MKTLIKAGIVYPVTAEPFAGGVAVANGAIVELFTNDKTPKEAFDKTIDLSDHLLLPGFVNAHSHLQLAFARGKIKPGLPFTDWLRRVIVLQQSVADGERVRGMEEGIAEMLESGITAVADIVTDVRFAEPLIASPLRSVVFVEALGPHSKGAGPIAEIVSRQIAPLIERDVSIGISPHAPHTVSKELFELMKTEAADKKIPLMTHIAETPEEGEFIKNGTGPIADLLRERGLMEKRPAFGASPVKLLDAYGVLEGLLAVHLNEIDHSDEEILRSKGAVPVFCPASSQWFGRGKVMPFDSFLESGPPPAIGTDSLASNSSLSMLDELRAALGFFPDAKKKNLIEAATINGAKSLGLPCGSIERGKAADLIAFRLDDLSNPLDAVFDAKKADFVMISGKVA